MTAGLPESLRLGTRSLHIEVERTDFMRAMLRGQMGQASYCLLLRNLHPVYDTLERSLLAHAQHPLLTAMCMPPLFRTGALEQDLDALAGTAWRSRLQVQPSCKDYVQRLQEIHLAQPELLVAHAYVRYLGDLSGGQQLKRVVVRCLELSPGLGTAFYDFGDADQTAVVTREFRARLGSLPANQRQIAEIVAEAQSAFRRHGELFRQLATASGIQAARVSTGP